ncbi:ATP-binding protein [Aeoliella sp. ICT_H6.2]|uniref:histidine kinase n=1 Tax=Aeoliella straminimaris TaxID=2954799 RepID=A0A9X2JHM1_9BACT|nr:ATP-binding protein [Aeoliella straminimaris]
MISLASQNRSTPTTPEGRRLTVLYIFALSAVAILSIGAQWLIQQQLTRGEGDSQIVNIAGRQRMLSQRLAKTALQINKSESAQQSPMVVELQETLNEWEDNHLGLQTLAPAGLLHEENSEAVQELFASIRPDFEAMRQSATSIVDQTGSSDDIRQPVAVIERHEGRFLEGMDRIVSQYVEEAEAKVTRLRRLEFTLLVLTLSILSAEGLLIFRPAVRRIENAVAHLATLSERLRTARDQAEQANAAKTRFLANVSHELRTPMTAVLGMTEMARTTNNETKQQEYLAIIEEAGTSLLGLLNDLIDLAAIDANELKLQVAEFEPARLCKRVAAMMQPEATAKGLQLTDEVDDTGLRVMGDERRVQQVLLNLVANAIKCTPVGSVAIRCLATPADEGRVCLTWEVEDTGIGIEASEQQRIFEPFTRLHDTDSSGKKGVGLGLAICRRITAAMNATIDVVSQVGQGTTVRFSCNFWVAHNEEAPHPAPQFHQLQTLRILVVEDTELNQKLFRELLEREGHRVTTANSGEQAIDIYQQESFDCTLIDLQLPGIDGIETARTLRAIDARRGRTSTPQVNLTAHAAPQHADVFAAMLTKPITRDRLLQTLDNVLGDTRESTNTSSDTCPMDESFYQELASTYLEVAPQQFAEVDQAVAEGSLQAASIVVHRLRGQVAYFESGPLLRQLQQLEDDCSRGRRNAAVGCWPVIKEQLHTLCDTLRQECSPNSPSSPR